jgi:hypothetical protein
MKANRCRVLLGSVATLLSIAVPAQVTYGLKETEPRVGTTVRVEVVRSPIPFDRKYDELTAEQKEVLRSKYDKLDANDEPPFPVEGMVEIGREIARLESSGQYRGPLIMTVQVDAKGEAQSTAVYKTPNEDFSKSVAVVAMRAKYKPAKCDGKPCAMDFPLIIDLGASEAASTKTY